MFVNIYSVAFVCTVDRGREEERKGGDVYIVIISIQRLNDFPCKIMDQRKAEADQILRSLKAESIELKDEVRVYLQCTST